MKKTWAPDGNLLTSVIILQSKTGGARPARRLTFVHAATKGEALKSLVTYEGSVGFCSTRTFRIEVAAFTCQTCPAQRNVEVKDMVTYVYNSYRNPDGFDFDFELHGLTKKGNR